MSANMKVSDVKEFVPKGMVVKTEDQFPDLDALDAEATKPKGKKNKKGGADKIKAV